jgi:RND family efflux transporter MFP subunit
LKLQLQTPEQRASRAQIGMTVLARVSAYPGRDFTGKVSAINPSVDPNSRIFILEARFPNSDSTLRPGMFSTARVLLPGGEDGIFIPRNALLRDKTTDSWQVYVIQGGKARLHVVLAGDIVENQVRILSGLSANDTIAISNLTALYDGAPVSTQAGRS